MNEIIYSSASELAQQIRSGELSAREVTEIFIARIEQVNPKINAVVTTCFDRALKEANSLDTMAMNKQFKGPLHGIPITVKDSLDTEGVISTGGTEGRKYFIPDEDATTVKGLREAGAILLGKTNTPELTYSGETENTLFGRTNNPFHLDYGPGGSSGGSAAAIATGCSALELGSDTAGSIREPAHLCGITGIKPTSGRMSRQGHIVPHSTGVLDSWTQIGPMARYVKDLELALPLICKPDGLDPTVAPVEFGNPNNIDVTSLRIAVYTDNGVIVPHDDICNTVNVVADKFSNMGLKVVSDKPDGLAEATDLHQQLRLCVSGGDCTNLLRNYGTKTPGPYMQKILDLWKSKKRMLDPELLYKIDQVKFKANQFWSKCDVIICPPSHAIPRLHGESLSDVLPNWSHISLANFFGWPGAVLRTGTTQCGKFPVGAQIMAPHWREDVIFAIARIIEREFGGFKPPPI